MNTLTIAGPYVAGECPEPLEYTWLDADGQPLDLSDGFDAKIRWRVNRGVTVEHDAALTDAANGVYTYAWTDGDLDEPGTYEGEFEVSNGTNEYRRRWAMRVRPAIPAPSP